MEATRYVPPSKRCIMLFPVHTEKYTVVDASVADKAFRDCRVHTLQKRLRLTPTAGHMMACEQKDNGLAKQSAKGKQNTHAENGLNFGG